MRRQKAIEGRHRIFMSFVSGRLCLSQIAMRETTSASSSSPAARSDTPTTPGIGSGNFGQAQF